MQINPKVKILLSIAVILGIVLFGFWLSQTAADNTIVQDIISDYGYFGIFIAAVISGFNIIVPIPAVSFIPALIESGLNYWVCIFILALGMTIADLAAYVLGRAGRGVISEKLNNKMIKTMDNLKDKHPIIPLASVFLFASVVPVPNEVIVVPLGFLRYRLTYLIIVIFLGNLVFNTLYSKGLLSLFGIFN